MSKTVDAKSNQQKTDIEDSGESLENPAAVDLIDVEDPPFSMMDEVLAINLALDNDPLEKELIADLVRLELRADDSFRLAIRQASDPFSAERHMALAMKFLKLQLRDATILMQHRAQHSPKKLLPAGVSVGGGWKLEALKDFGKGSPNSLLQDRVLGWADGWEKLREVLVEQMARRAVKPLRASSREEFNKQADESWLYPELIHRTFLTRTDIFETWHNLTAHYWSVVITVPKALAQSDELKNGTIAFGSEDADLNIN